MKQMSVPDPQIPLVERGRSKTRFDVHVCNVSNPRLFYVQPLASLNMLSALMHKLQVIILTVCLLRNSNRPITVLK